MKILNLQFENMTFRKPWIMRWKLGRTKNRRIINSTLPRVLLFTGWHYASFIITDYIIQQQKMDGNKNRIMLSLLLQAWIKYCEIGFLIYSRCDTYSTKTMVEIKLFDKLLQKWLIGFGIKFLKNPYKWWNSNYNSTSDIFVRQYFFLSSEHNANFK